jgi:hypothetical protein
VIIESEMKRNPTLRAFVSDSHASPHSRLTVADGVHNALSRAPQTHFSHKTAPAGGIGGRRTVPSSARSPAMDNPPNNNIHTIVRAQIVFLLSTLTEDNFDRNQAEIRSVCPLAFWVAGLLIPISCTHSYPNNMGSKHICILSGV